MNELTQEVELLKNEIDYLINNFPDLRDYDLTYEYDQAIKRHQQAIIRKMEMLSGTQDMIIKLQARDIADKQKRISDLIMTDLTKQAQEMGLYE